jgi:hypothetical protein
VWPVTARPLTVVGATAGDPNQELVGITGAFRQEDGHLVAVASDPLQIRRYEEHGTFLARIGQHGSGPGEYRGRVTIYPLRGDSIVAFDDQTSRWTLYLPNGTLVRSWVSTPEERRNITPIAYRRTLIHATGQPLSACLRPLIDRLPPPHDTAYRELVPDGADRVWLRDEGSATWSVRAADGRELGRVLLPAGFEMMQIRRDVVVGRRRDADGLERIEVFGVTMPPHSVSPACARRGDEFPPDTSLGTRVLAIDLRNLEAAGTAFRMDYGHYAGTLDSVTNASNFVLSAGTVAQIHAAHDGVGWDVVARTATGPRFCRILVGEIAPVWMYRLPFCGP